MERACAEIDLSKLRNNLNIIRKYIKSGVKIGAVVKADAYGHGAINIAAELSNNKQIQMLMVGTEEEAVEIYQSGCVLPLLILGNILYPEPERLLTYNFVFSAYNLEFLRYAEHLAERHKRKIRIHLRIDIQDTGMGFGISDFIKHQKEIFEMDHIIVEGIYAHLYSSYSFRKEFILKELNQFTKAVELIPEDIRKKTMVHICNSALLFEYPDYHFDMVRTGTALYGLPCNPKNSYKLQPILTLKTRIVSINTIRVNQTVSYLSRIPENQNKAMMVAHISFGYWDCPLLMTQKNIKVWVKGKLYSLKDEASMDNACILISENSNLQTGDEVILLGDKPGITLPAILRRLNIPLVHSEWVCMISKRISKKYLS